MFKLDKTAKQILYLLDSNARSSFSQIAKKLSIPEATVRYRVNGLLDEGIIQRSYPVFGAGRVGMSVHKLMFKLHKADENEIDKIVLHLSHDPLVNWVARFDGSYDLGCTLLVRHVGQVSKFLDQIRQKFYSQVRQLSYAVNIHAEFFPRDYLVRNRRLTAKGADFRSYAEDDKSIELDRVDWKITQAVTDDSRASSKEIAIKAGVSPETVTRRLASLEKQGVITGYRLDLNPQKLKRTSYYILLYLNFVSADKLNKMLSYLRFHASVIYIIKMLGEWDYDVSIELEDAEAYRAFIIDLLKNFSDVIREIETLTTWKVAKFSILPKSGQVV